MNVLLTGDLGRVALQLSLFVAAALFGVSVYSAGRPAHPLSKWAQPLAFALFGLVVVASASLITLLASLNFHYAYVVDYTSHSLPPLYRIAAFWGGDAGSLLFWLLVM
ncbi:MAG: hypothetical protein OWU32_10080, partial [Firmicutes bacterium]|nr:hypothetical protein [Bacillota bacterium]